MNPAPDRTIRGAAMHDTVVRSALSRTSDGGHAHMRFAEAVANFPPEHYNTRPPHVSYSFWHLLEHIRICLERMIAYVEGGDFPKLEFPRDYWPAPDAVARAAEWDATVDAIQSGISTLHRWASDPGIDLAGVAHHAQGNEDQTRLYEMLDNAIHTSYHLGEFTILRQVLGLWPADHE
jgi:hypothetical protein